MSQRSSLIASYLVGLDGQQVKMAPDQGKALLSTAKPFLELLLEQSRTAIEDGKIAAAQRTLEYVWEAKEQPRYEIHKRINGAFITDVVIPMQYDLLVMKHEYLRWLAHQRSQLQPHWAVILYPLQLSREQADQLLEWQCQAVEDGMNTTSGFAGDSRRITPQKDMQQFAANQRPEMRFTFTPR